MRKLLLLGGTRYLLPVIRKAHDMGLYVITADNVPGNPAHKYSDQYENVSTIDRNAVLKCAQENKVDGLMAFACDNAVVTAAYVSTRMGLSTPPLESVEILQDKSRFRDFLSKNGFNVPFFQEFNNIDDAFDSSRSFPYPMIVKPVDSCGSKGVSRVDDASQLLGALKRAEAASFKKAVIVEQFLIPDGNPSDSDCFSIDGKLVFTSFSDQYFDSDSGNPYTPIGYAWPRAFGIEVKTYLESEIQRLLSLLAMSTSLYNIETRVSNSVPYIMECSPRGGGNRICEMLEHVYGVDLISMAIKSALGDYIACPTSSGASCYLYETILHSNKGGLFDGIVTDNQYDSMLVERDVWVEKGDLIRAMDGANTTIGTLVHKFDDSSRIMSFIDNSFKYSVNLS